MQNGIVIVIHSRIIIFIQKLIIDQLLYGILCQIGVDRTCSIPQKCCEMMHLSRLTGFQNNGKGRSLLCLYQILMHCGDCQK